MRCLWSWYVVVIIFSTRNVVFGLRKFLTSYKKISQGAAAAVSRGAAAVFLGSCLLFREATPAAAAPELLPPPYQQQALGVLTEEDNNLVRMGFRDMDAMRFEAAEKEFSLALKRWNDLQRPRDEIVSLLKARANVLVDSKQFDRAIEDYNRAIELMAVDGEKSDGTAQYPEFPDAFVGRALAKEGLAQWADAITDYSKAITLWGGGRGDGVNPYVLTYRGNSLSKLGKFGEAIEDYRASSDLFLKQRDIARWSDAKANLALTLYAEDRTDESVKAMRDVLRRDAGYADMHVALATTLWDKGSYIQAIAEWDLVCNGIDVGCDKYRDLDWVTRVRRWPANLASKLEAFLERRVPQNLLDKSESLRRSLS